MNDVRGQLVVLLALLIAWTAVLWDHNNKLSEQELPPAKFEVVSAPEPSGFVIAGTLRTAVEKASEEVYDAVASTDSYNIRLETQEPEAVRACVRGIQRRWGTVTSDLYDELGPEAFGDLRICFDPCVRVSPRGQDASMCTHHRHD